MMARCAVVIGLLLLMCAPARADEDARTYFERATAQFALGKFAEAATNFEKCFELRPDPAILYNAAQARRLSGNKQRALELYLSYTRIYGDRIDNKSEVQRHIENLRAAIAKDQQVASSPPITTKPPPVVDKPAPVVVVAKPAPVVVVAKPAPVVVVAKPAPVVVVAKPAPVVVKPAPVVVKPPPVVVATVKPAVVVKPRVVEERAPYDVESEPVVVEKPAPVVVEKPAPTTVIVETTPPAREKPLVKKAWFWGVVAGAVVVVAVGVSLGVVLGSPSPRSPSPTFGVANGN